MLDQILAWFKVKLPEVELTPIEVLNTIDTSVFTMVFSSDISGMRCVSTVPNLAVWCNHLLSFTRCINSRIKIPQAAVDTFVKTEALVYVSDLYVENGKVLSDEYLNLFKSRAVEFIHAYETVDISTNEVSLDNHYVLGTVVDRLNNFIMELKRVEKEIIGIRQTSPTSRTNTGKRRQKYLG